MFGTMLAETGVLMPVAFNLTPSIMVRVLQKRISCHENVAITRLYWT